MQNLSKIRIPFSSDK